MNKYLSLHSVFILLALSIVSVCTKAASKSNTDPLPGAVPDTIPTGYKLIWSDEFDNSINAATWNFETGGEGWGNHEQEYYQQANASVENGNLIITAKKESVDSNKYTSARMTTQAKKEFLYGRVEARIKMPVGAGFWPAFWMLGSNIKAVGWPAAGEIDIMEHINADSIIYGTLHWDSSGHISKGNNVISTPSAYHVYAVEWNVNSIKWFVDSTQYHEVDIAGNSTSEFHLPFYILLNFATGGDWPGQTIDDSLLPAKMYVDYVRVYQKQ